MKGGGEARWGTWTEPNRLGVEAGLLFPPEACRATQFKFELEDPVCRIANGDNGIC